MGFHARLSHSSSEKLSRLHLPSDRHYSSIHRVMDPVARVHRPLQPAPPKEKVEVIPRKTCFYDLPPELRVEIYKLVLENVYIHILPPETDSRQKNPHALVRTSRQVRHEVLPIIHGQCRIHATVTDFDFAGLLEFLSRIPPHDEKCLLKNGTLSIRLCTTLSPPGNLDSLRRWLHYRADKCRPQPNWRYSGPPPSSKVANDLKRRVKRMKEEEKKKELEKMVKAIGVHYY